MTSSALMPKNPRTSWSLCVEVSSSSGQALPPDYCISEWMSCNNKCVQAYGPSFILVNRMTDGDARAVSKAGLQNVQAWDLWFDDPAYPDRKWAHTLSWDPTGLQQTPPVYVPVMANLPPQFPPSYKESLRHSPSGPGQKIYVGDFPLGSWELSLVKAGVTYTIGTPKAVVPQSDGSHLIYDDPPSPGTLFPHRQKRDLLLLDEDAGGEEMADDTPRNAFISTPELHTPNLFRRAAELPETSFLDARVYTEVLGCPLDSELDACTDCDIQGGPAPFPARYGTTSSTAATTTSSTTSTAATSLPTIPPDTRPACFLTTDHEHQSFTLEEYQVARLGLCNGNTLHVDDDLRIWTYPNTNLVASSAWAADQAGCYPRSDFLMTQPCETWMDEILQDCDHPIQDVEYYGGTFVWSGNHGCVTFYLGKQLLVS